MTSAIPTSHRPALHPSHDAELRRSILCLAVIAVLTAVCWSIMQLSGKPMISVIGPLHRGLQLLSIVIAGLVVATDWSARSGKLTGNTVVLACTFIGVGMLDFSRSFSVPDMPGFFTINTPAKAMAFELASTTLASTALLALAIQTSPVRASGATRAGWLAGSIAFCVLVHWAVFLQPELVAAWMSEAGILQSLPGAMTLLAVVLLLRRLRSPLPHGAVSLLGAALMMTLATFLLIPVDRQPPRFEVLGQLCRLAAYLFVYRLVFLEQIAQGCRELDLVNSRLAALQDMIIEVDMDGICHYFHAPENIMLHPKVHHAAAFADQSVYQILPAKSAANLRDVMHAVLHETQQNGKSAGTELLLDLPAGPRWFELSSARKASPPGEQFRMIVSLHDITRRHALEQQLHLLQKTMAGINDMLVITEAEPFSEPGPKIVFVNDAFSRVTGYSCAEVIGKTPRILQGKNTQPAELQRIRVALSRWESVRVELINYTKSGREFWVEMEIIPIADDTGCYTHWVSIERDISERKLLEQRLAESARHTQTILDNVVDAVITIDQAGTIASFNLAATTMFGYAPDEVIGQNVSVLMPQPYRDGHDGYLRHYQRTGIKRVIGFGREVQGERKLGGTFPISLAVSEIERDGKPMFIGLVRDITQRQKDEARIERLAFYDQLTDLPNRRLLLERMERALLASRRTLELGAVIFIDLDDFKKLNDTWGHETGDQMLVQVAQRLMQCVRASDTVARLGGDEFVVMLGTLGQARAEAATHAETVASKILTSFAQPFSLNDRSHHSSASLGITLFGDEALSVDALMGRADSAMYQAKADGRSTYRFFDAHLQAALAIRAALEHDLGKSLLHNELLLHYQPQVDLYGNVLGAEALLRWSHPVRGSVSPAEFIPIAEHNGFILELGQWVLMTACTQLAAWADSAVSAHLSMSVNVSARQFRQPQFVSQVLDALAHTGARPQLLKLELTESMLIDDIDGVIEKMSLLKTRGVCFSLDDFGTGYSSLSYLKRLPLDQLKIDQSFVRDVLIDSHDAAIARTVVALGQSLGLAVIAEGVESVGQRDFLEQNGCHTFQGYLFSRPLSAERFGEFIRAQASAAMEPV